MILAVLLAFGASLAGSFHLDDYSLFSQDLWRPLELRPLTYLTFWVNDRLGGQQPAGYHAVNLALHIVAVLLLWHALRRLIPAWAAFASAAIFAVHPLVAEPVNYVFERSTILATVFCLAALLAWTRQRFWLAIVWFGAALLSKEECAAFPVFLLLLYWTGSRARRELQAILVMLALSLAAGIRVMLAGATTHGSGIGGHAGVSALDYSLTQGTVIWRYLRQLALPWGFSVDPEIAVVHGIPALAAWGTVLAAVWLASRRFSRDQPGFWFLGGLLLLLPSSSLFPAADLAADRRMYLPLVAFSAALGIAFAAIKRRELVWIVVAVLAAFSLERTLVWRTEVSLWSDAVAKAPGKIRPKIQLARAVGGAQGLAILAQAKSIAPADPRVASEEGRMEISQSNPQQALVSFGRALALDPSSAAAHSNRGLALLMLGQSAAARSDFERALSLDICQFDARLNLLRLGVSHPVAPDCRFSSEQRQALQGKQPGN
ncbi:MAG: glycosyltransferase family 39 protein [Acidobacteriota bacterium]|nr:glycosyltransferase family 39 protein [Acidobacteriota bacterium]